VSANHQLPLQNEPAAITGIETPEPANPRVLPAIPSLQTERQKAEEAQLVAGSRRPSGIQVPILVPHAKGSSSVPVEPCTASADTDRQIASRLRAIQRGPTIVDVIQAEAITEGTEKPVAISDRVERRRFVDPPTSDGNPEPAALPRQRPGPNEGERSKERRAGAKRAGGHGT
jgi:hypothetical protein